MRAAPSEWGSRRAIVCILISFFADGPVVGMWSRCTPCFCDIHVVYLEKGGSTRGVMVRLRAWNLVARDHLFAVFVWFSLVLCVQDMPLGFLLLGVSLLVVFVFGYVVISDRAIYYFFYPVDSWYHSRSLSFQACPLWF